MALVTLEEAKAHLRVTHTDEDTRISAIIDAAEKHIKNFLNQDQIPMEPDVKQAALLYIGDFYENREATTEKDLKENRAAKNLLFPYRVNMGI